MNPMVVCGGRVIDLDSIKESDVDVEMIAFGNAHQRRYCGHAGDWSVVEHSCCAALIAVASLGIEVHDSAAKVRAVLHHDAPEAIYGDTIRPHFKYLSSPAYVSFRACVDHTVNRALDLGDTESDLVRRCDLLMLEAEKQVFFPGTADWTTSAQMQGDPLLSLAKVLIKTTLSQRMPPAILSRWYVEFDHELRMASRLLLGVEALVGVCGALSRRYLGV